MKEIKRVLIGVCFLALLFFGVISYKLFRQQIVVDEMKERLLHITDKSASFSGASSSVKTPQIVEKMIGKNHVWRSVQESVKDTVVQVFSQVVEIDMLQPYKTPSQGQSFGSGFFINEEGDILTNAHVVNQARTLWVQVPSLGKRIIDVELVGMSPERDLALLRLTDESKKIIKSELGKISHLQLGNSDLLRRADEVMALGYPLGQQSLKSTTGVISGREGGYIQISAAINPGNSGGPLVNLNGEVVGINSAKIHGADNVGYMIPINDLRVILSDLYSNKLLRKPFLGVLFNNASDFLAKYLGNPLPGGCYVVEVIKNSTLYNAGVRTGDMIYEINGHRLDVYGEMNVVWSEDKISLIDYVSRLSVGQNVNLVVYRNGKKKNINVTFNQTELPAVRMVYPGLEEIDYEVFGGMVVMDLTLNHLQILAKRVPGLMRYADIQNRAEPKLVITHIFPTSQLQRTRALMPGCTLNEVNGIKVTNLADFRKALKNCKNGCMTIKATDHFTRVSDNIFVVLPMDKILQEEAILARDYHYPLSNVAKELVTKNLGDKNNVLKPIVNA